MEFKSKLVQCPHGHYYNSALHDSCPVCLDENRNSHQSAPAPAAKVPQRSYASAQDPAAQQAVASEAAGKKTEAVPSPVTEPGKAPDNTSFDPVVGWLVCIEGPVRGRDFRLHSGYNFIGRETGDICIPGDLRLAAQNHAMVTYDDVDRLYYVGPSVGRELIRVNSHAIFGAVALNNYDVISLGATKLMFVGLCSEKFDWSAGEANP